MRLSCQQLRVLRSDMRSRVRTSGDIRGRGGRGHALPGHRGVCALSPSSPASSGYRRETRHRGEVAPSWGARPGAGPQGRDRSLPRVSPPPPPSLAALAADPPGAGGRRVLCACAGGPRPQRQTRGRLWLKVMVPELVSVISADTHAQGPVLSRSVPGGGAWWGPLRKPCPPVLL